MTTNSTKVTTIKFAATAHRGQLCRERLLDRFTPTLPTVLETVPIPRPMYWIRRPGPNDLVTRPCRSPHQRQPSVVAAVRPHPLHAPGHGGHAQKLEPAEEAVDEDDARTIVEAGMPWRLAWPRKRKFMPDFHHLTGKVKIETKSRTYDVSLTAWRLFADDFTMRWIQVTLGASVRADSPTSTQSAGTSTLVPASMLHSPLVAKPFLVLDMDETLIHSVSMCAQGKSVPGADFTIAAANLWVKERVDRFSVLVRSGAVDFLRRVAQCYAVVVYTAGTQPYADAILNVVDPGNKDLSGRLYQDSCAPSLYSKDLTKVCGDLSRVIIVDNAAKSFGKQAGNGLLISSWYQNPVDQELERLADFLLLHKNAVDVRLAAMLWRPSVNSPPSVTRWEHWRRVGAAQSISSMFLLHIRCLLSHF
ncbi:NLI interacting factor-like phosphatase-domain-containing protein [Catenaria anguillulae PL171]|uniref:Mitochondrial import inner membrane translocase subunit TIM50 n=1 Tax=Catenaria anguillulae PL171 TaxID=765915 RepID=A0A1Y2HZU1_9FUNG|nr:NLI interacting factor-like phosphatase-domain-containing protein [Catenaria anguillulae PL171]